MGENPKTTLLKIKSQKEVWPQAEKLSTHQTINLTENSSEGGC